MHNIIWVLVGILLAAIIVASIRQEQEIMATICSTELIDYTGMNAGEISTFLNYLKLQSIPELTLRIPGWSDWTDETLSATYKTVSESIITAAQALDNPIDINIDLHSWYTTWDSYFDDDAADEATNRAKYLNWIDDCITKLDVSGVKAWMVLNEPQAQTASSSENNFILDCISTAKAATSNPVSVRFMAGYSSITGHYSSAIASACDFIAVNTYWDPRYPATSKYGTTETKMNATINYCQNNSKELWITEFGNSGSSTAQTYYVRGFVDYAQLRNIDRIFCWVSDPDANADSYNIWSGYTPKQAFYELKNSPQAPPLGTDEWVMKVFDANTNYPVAGVRADFPNSSYPTTTFYTDANGMFVFSATTGSTYGFDFTKEGYEWKRAHFGLVGYDVYNNSIVWLIDDTYYVPLIPLAPYVPPPPDYYYVNVAADVGGQVIPQGDVTKLVGQPFVASATPNTDYLFKWWTRNGIQVSTEATYVMNDGTKDVHYELIAYFSANVPTEPDDPTAPAASQYSVNIGASTGGTTDLTGEQTYDLNTAMNVTAFPSTNYRFSYWLFDNSATQHGSLTFTYTGTTSDKHTLLAVFTPFTPPQTPFIPPAATVGELSSGGMFDKIMENLEKLEAIDLDSILENF